MLKHKSLIKNYDGEVHTLLSRKDRLLKDVSKELQKVLPKSTVTYVDGGHTTMKEAKEELICCLKTMKAKI